MTDSNKARECAECGSSATYCVAMRKDDEHGLRVVGEVMRHICAICGHTELLSSESGELCSPAAPRTAAKPDDRD